MKMTGLRFLAKRQLSVTSKARTVLQESTLQCALMQSVRMDATQSVVLLPPCERRALTEPWWRAKHENRFVVGRTAGAGLLVMLQQAGRGKLQHDE